jgi:hypothetical protein
VYRLLPSCVIVWDMILQLPVDEPRSHEFALLLLCNGETLRLMESCKCVNTPVAFFIDIRGKDPHSLIRNSNVVNLYLYKYVQATYRGPWQQQG